MQVPPAPSHAQLTRESAVEGLAATRARTFALIDGLSASELEQTHSTLMSPLVWDLAHIAAYEDLWIAHRNGGRPLLRPDLAETYDAAETPRSARGAVECLGLAEALGYMADVREGVLEVIDAQGVGSGELPEMVIRHEAQHHETMLQTLGLARLDHHRPADRRPDPEPVPGGAPTGLELIELAGATFTQGAGEDGFAFDNERPAHEVTVAPFAIGAHPVTNGAWLEFVCDGGYSRRELWSEEGWRWLQSTGVQVPGGWRCESDRPRADGVWEWRIGGYEALVSDRPVVHVCCHEAEAFAAAHGLRLPSEAEWEYAARGTGEEGGAVRATGEAEPNLIESGHYGTSCLGRGPRPASPCGAMDMIGEVWEWTAEEFHPYPGFVAHPYPQYSEVFFDGGYRVLRGGSWASSERYASPTFRNWDLPVRRQIFAGVRVARSL